MKSTVIVVIVVNNLYKHYGMTKAIDGVSFEVYEHEIFGIVGPNGAGKTTTVECIEGLRIPDKGAIKVLGLDPQRDQNNLRQFIGIQLQEGRLPSKIKVWEALDLFGSFYHSAVDWEPIMEELSLIEKRNAYYEDLSSGQKQRLAIALSLVSTPKILFFDELTTGLDPQARRDMWNMVRKFRDEGKTIVLVTHFMDEAEILCDRVAIIDKGKIIAIDTPGNLIKSTKLPNQIEFFTNDILAFEILRKGLKDEIIIQQDGEKLIISSKNEEAISEIINTLAVNRIPFRNLSVRQPNLEDIYLHLTQSKMSNQC